MIMTVDEFIERDKKDMSEGYVYLTHFIYEDNWGEDNVCILYKNLADRGDYPKTRTFHLDYIKNINCSKGGDK